MSGAGDALRARREARGFTLERASVATRIPADHLEAMEQGRLDALPDGPYRAGQIRAYCAWLGEDPGPLLDQASAVQAPAEPARATPLWGVRIAAATLCAVLLALVAWPAVRPDTPQAEVAHVPEAPDQRVSVTARRTTHVKVLVDGEVVLDRALPGGESIEVAGHRRVEVQLQGADAARVEYNGDRIVPQGRQDMPRRLVFIDDEG